MRVQRLLERLKTIEKNPGNRFLDNESDMANGIIEHLQKLLNTRQGSALIAEDYGIPDFTELLHSYPESIREMERALRSAIRKYEPRLERIKVRFLPDENDPLNIRFEILAKLAGAGRESPAVFFESVVDADGRIRIRR